MLPLYDYEVDRDFKFKLRYGAVILFDLEDGIHLNTSPYIMIDERSLYAGHISIMTDVEYKDESFSIRNFKWEN